MKNESGPFFVLAPAILAWPIILILVILYHADELKSLKFPLLILTALITIGALFLGFYGYCWVGIATGIVAFIVWLCN